MLPDETFKRGEVIKLTPTSLLHKVICLQPISDGSVLVIPSISCVIATEAALPLFNPWFISAVI